MEKQHIIHITHNDGDAVGCAMVASAVFWGSDITDNTYFCAIGTQDDKIKEVLTKEIDKEIYPWAVIISDISLSFETCKWLNGLALKHGFKLLGVDHHATNTLNEYFNWFKVYSSSSYLDKYYTEALTPISAAEAMLGIEFPSLYTRNTFVDLIKMISRYDTWTWRTHPYDWTKKYINMSDDIVAKVCSFMGAEECFKSLWAHWYDYFDISKEMKTLVPESFFSIYWSLKAEEERYIKTLPNKAHVVYNFLNKYTIAIIISENIHGNAACEYIYNNYDFIDIVVVVYLSSGKLGLRTKRDDINLGEMVKSIYMFCGGGGHSKAAGASIQDTEMLAVVASYLMKSITLEEADTIEKSKNLKGDEDGAGTSAEPEGNEKSN